MPPGKELQREEEGRTLWAMTHEEEDHADAYSPKCSEGEF
jgi:hypothetical protein